MNSLTILTLAGALTMPLLAQPTITDDRGPLVQVTVDRLEFAGISADNAHFQLFTHIAAFRNTRVKRVRFSGMRLGDIPFFMEPMEEHIQLKAGESTAAPPIPVTIYFRDLDSLKAVEEAIRSGEMQVSGRARAELDLGLLERAAVWQWSGRADVALSGKLPVEAPGGDIGKAAAILAVRGAEAALPAAGSTLSQLRGQGAMRGRDVKDAYSHWLVVADSKYSLIMEDGRKINLSASALGIRVSDDLVVLTGEELEPWKYDPDVALALSNGAKLVPEARDLTIKFDGARGDAPALSNGGLHIERSAAQLESVLVQDDEKRIRVQVAKRDSNSNYALIRIVHAEGGSLQTGLFSSQTMPGNYERVAVFHVTTGGKLEVILVPAHARNGRITLDSPVDDSAFGSIVVAPDGIVGLVQDERSAMFLTADRLQPGNGGAPQKDAGGN